MSTRKAEVSGNNSGPSPKAMAQLKNLRSQIDKLDLQVLKLINDRAGLAAEIGKLKKELGGEIFSPSREEEVFDNVINASKGPLSPVTIRAVFREIMSGSRALEKVIKVAYLGPEFSFSHVAGVERFGNSAEFMPVGSITAVFEMVNRSQSEFGVVPLENSTDGRVADTLEMFIRLPQVKICSEIRLRIHHNLLANCEQHEIRRVYSKPQALSQCRHWLAKNVPHAAVHEVASTSIAAKLAQGEHGMAAIASRQAAVAYGLKILFPDIEDSPYNETLFAIIGTQEAGKTGNDKTSVMFKPPHSHQSGALADTLNLFKQAKISLSWIESFPAPGPKQEYLFFVDFEGHAEEPKVKRLLTALQDHCSQVSVLGSYPVAKLLD
jgi:chorismate mutase/prephenate dehydratase